MQTITRAQLGPALDAVMTISEAIRTAGEIPAGVLYATLCGRMDLASFNGLVKVLQGAGLVERTPAHMLRWVGPVVGVGARS